LRAFVAIDAVVHQGMTGVEELLNLINAVALSQSVMYFRAKIR
jgi:hypothetical protein